MWELVFGGTNQSLSCQAGHGSLCHLVYFRVCFMAVVNAAQRDGTLRCLGKAHPRTAALAKHALIGDFIVFRLSTVRPGCNLTQSQLAFVGNSVGRATHRVCRLAATGGAGVRNML